jgi:hypothetical protein
MSADSFGENSTFAAELGDPSVNLDIIGKLKTNAAEVLAKLEVCRDEGLVKKAKAFCE